MEIELVSRLQGAKMDAWKALLERSGLEPDTQWESTVLIWDDEQLIAAASRKGNLLKCIAVDDTRQGEGLTATLLTRVEFGKKNLLHFYLELDDAEAVTPTVAAIQKLYPGVKHPEITAAKSGLPGAVGLSLIIATDQKELETVLNTLADMDHVLFAVEE